MMTEDELLEKPISELSGEELEKGIKTIQRQIKEGKA